MRIRRGLRLSILVGGTVAALALCVPAATAAKGVVPGFGASGGEGVQGPPDEAGAAYRYVSLYGDGRGTTLLRIEADGGAIDRERWLQSPWALPAVTISGEAGGLSADGRTLVLTESGYEPRLRETDFMVLDAERLRTRERFTLPGAYSFDAISPDGRLAYLVEYEDPRNPFDYRIRAYDLQAGAFRPGEIVDPSEPEERMSGQPVARATSDDGRWAYTLYAGGEETFIHALDTVGATAVCVDLEELPPEDAYTLRLEIDPASGEVSVLQRREPVATVDPESFEVTAVVAEPGPEASSGSGDGASGDWVAPTAIAAGVALLIAASMLLLRRHRRAAA